MSINIVLTGANGRMGKTIYGLLTQDSAFKVAALVVQSSEAAEVKQHAAAPVFTSLEDALKQVKDAVIIDFTAPEASMAFARTAATFGARHVIGTTGLTEAQRAELADLAKKTAILWSPNMSVGINVLLKLLPELTRMLGPDYDVDITEIHHKKKKDSPSGTALRLGEAIAEGKGWSLKESACYHREGIIGERPQKEIGLQAVRGGDVVGVHTVYFMGPGERIEVNHQAHSRENFAQGALRAARWLAGQPAGRLYSVTDMLNQ